MASLVLNVATRAVSAALSAVAARAIGTLFADDVDGPRLSEVRLQSSSEGAGLPIVFGRMRLAGQLIWATRFTETATTTSAGGKGGGPKVTEYRYSVSFAVAICEGSIDGVARVWADGRPLDLSAVTMRVYPGDEDQEPDPLIEAVEGSGDVPAFRGVAYAVFEDLTLDGFGNRIPQLTFEVLRAPGGGEGPRLQDLARGVTLIPASGEFAYATTIVRTDLGPGVERAENANNSRGVADVIASIDDLEAQLGAIESVMIVTAWFGDDLRCGDCTLRPGVEIAEKTTRPFEWTVNGVSREDAYVVSQLDGHPVYGGTPSDKSLLELIALLKARGYAVGLYPFILMDLPAGNALPDPYGGAEQAAYPWRGRITCHPAPGEPGSPDKTSAAGDEVDAFFGACAPGDFADAGETVAYSGPAEWSFRRMILHYARLAQIAGGVDAFMIGSEMRGVTQLRADASSYPAVSALKTLAADVRSIVGGSTKISYAADWSEYFGHQPADGTGDVYFHLDALWSDPNVDFVGVDWYAPLSDWRDGAYHLDAGLGASDHRLDYLRSNVEGGEGFDWYYADPNDRLAQARTPITDGSAGKPWVFRYKDLRSWWSNLHYDRPGGSEDASPTSWVPESKPIWFVETGVPAVDKGANQPNVFHDPKSSESAVPHFSSGARDDLIQRRALEALLSYWEPSEGLNPTSSIYAGPMIASDRTHIWTWDSRPFPDFPARDEIWRDGPNWRLGHWLTGRIGLAPLALVVDEIASAAGDGLADASALEGLVAGYVIERPMAIRGALEPLARAYRFDAAERGGRVAFLPLSGPAVGELKLDDVAIGDGAVRIERIRADASEQPIDARIRFLDDTRDFRPGAASARGLDAALRPVVELAAPLVLDHATAERIARSWLVDAAAHAERVRLDAPPSALAIEPGDIVALDDGAGSADYFVARIDDRVSRALVLTRSADGPSGVFSGPDAGVSTPPTSAPAKPYGVVLDLPLLPTESERGGPLVAAAAAPWPGDVSARAGDAGAERARLRRRAGIGELQWDLYAGPVGRWDEGNVTRVRLHHGALSSATNEQVYAGANALAIEGGSGEWEVLQFRDAVLVSPGVFELRGLLRGLAGSEAGMGAPTSAGARVVVLDAAIAPAPLEPFERGGQLAWRFVAAGGDPFGSQAHLITAADARIDDRPLAPVHLRVGREPGGVRFSWIRRTRFEGDDWSAADAPLGEADERYLFELYKDGSPALTREPSGAETLVTLAEEAAIFAGAPLYAFDIAVSQISATFGPGSARRAMVYA